MLQNSLNCIFAKKYHFQLIHWQLFYKTLRSAIGPAVRTYGNTAPHRVKEWPYFVLSINIMFCPEYFVRWMVCVATVCVWLVYWVLSDSNMWLEYIEKNVYTKLQKLIKIHWVNFRKCAKQSYLYRDIFFCYSSYEVWLFWLIYRV